MTVRILEAVEHDLLEAARSLELRRSGQGAQLIAEYRAVLENLERLPQMYPATEDGLPDHETRNAVLAPLKCRIVYELHDYGVLVVAITHPGRRDYH